MTNDSENTPVRAFPSKVLVVKNNVLTSPLAKSYPNAGIAPLCKLSLDCRLLTQPLIQTAAVTSGMNVAMDKPSSAPLLTPRTPRFGFITWKKVRGY